MSSYIDNPLMPRPANNNVQVVDLQQKGSSQEDKSIVIKEEPLAASMVVVNGNGHAFDNATNPNLFNIEDTYIMTKDQADLKVSTDL